MTVTCFTTASRNSRWLHCPPECQSLTALSGPWRRQTNLTGLGTDRSATGVASDSSAARGICTRTGSGDLSMKELWIQEAYRKKEFQLVSVDTLLNWADFGTKAHVRAPDVVVEAGVTSPERGSDKGVRMSHVDGRRTPCKPRRGWRRS